jgi:hypothetical protein
LEVGIQENINNQGYDDNSISIRVKKLFTESKFNDLDEDELNTICDLMAKDV